ncbi:S9 family peptidase [Porticoccaceae bacterium]|nr:S9 family peptidase [Porticoccaceae bacterium]
MLTSDSEQDLNTMLGRYQRAQTFMQGAYKSPRLTLNSDVLPHWIGESDCFWYEKETLGGRCFRVVDAAGKSHRDAFDHQALASALATESGETLNADDLPLSDLELDLVNGTLTFSAFNKRWHFDGEQACCRVLPQEVRDWNWSVSPDGRSAVFVRDYNLWLHDLTSGQERPLTEDGSVLRVYAGSTTAIGNEPDQWGFVDALWSPNSERLLTQVIDTSKVRVGMPLIEYVPEDGSVSPKFIRPDRRVAVLDDEHIEQWQLLSIDVQSGAAQAVDCDPFAITYPMYHGFFYANRGAWGADSRHAYFIDQASDGTQTRVLKCDTHSGACRELFAEQADCRATIMPATHTSAIMMLLPESHELVWWSERSDWGHLYLMDLDSGEIKNTITQGNWVVRNVLHFDPTTRDLFIQTAGRVEGRNPYYKDVCRVNVDTGVLTPLLSTDHEYCIVDKNAFQFMVFGKKISAFSHSSQYFVATRSRVNDCPESVLVDRDGNERLSLEHADLSLLPPNWQWPEPTLVKGADGVTDIYAVLFKPSDFSPEKSYPVVDMSFSFSEPVGAFSNNAQQEFHYFSSQAYAELGFIVVRFNHRGDGLRAGAGLRHRSFFDARDTSVPYHNMADCAAGIKELCQRHSYMDGDRVGVTDYITVPTTLSAMLTHPEVYKVGVSSNATSVPACVAPILGGVGDFPPYEAFAQNLQGKLLLIHGMVDYCVPVASTLRIAEALQKADKPFDMLILPNVSHGSSAYCVRRGWDYLVEHLLALEPPKDFHLEF